jgi:hypothetical protein
MREGYQYFECPSNSDQNALKRTIEIDMDETMYLNVEYPDNKSVNWKMLIHQADRLFTFRQEYLSRSGTCQERSYDNGTGLDMGFVIWNDSANNTIRISLRVPQSGRAVDEFATSTETTLIKCCDKMRELVQIALADNSLEDCIEAKTRF